MPRSAVVLILTALAVMAWAVPAFAAGHGFTPQQPNQYLSLEKGDLGAQVNFGASKGPTLQWSYMLNAATRAGATGPMTEDADLYCNGRRLNYHDHHVVPVSYLVHSSVGPLSTACNYRLHIEESFPITKAGQDGTRIVIVDYAFFISYA